MKNLIDKKQNLEQYLYIKCKEWLTDGLLKTRLAFFSLAVGTLEPFLTKYQTGNYGKIVLWKSITSLDLKVHV